MTGPIQQAIMHVNIAREALLAEVVQLSGAREALESCIARFEQAREEGHRAMAAFGQAVGEGAAGAAGPVSLEAYRQARITEMVALLRAVLTGAGAEHVGIDQEIAGAQMLADSAERIAARLWSLGGS